MRLRFASILVLAAACGPSFTPFRFIEKSRVVGSTLSVAGDPTRTTPAPGDTATMELLTVDPGPRVGRTYFLVVCQAGDSNLPIVFCSDPTEFLTVAMAPTLPGAMDAKPNPSITFTVPDAATLGDAKEVWFFGAVCNGGTVRDPPMQGEAWEPCMPAPGVSPQPYGQLVSTRIKLELEPNDTNHTPALGNLAFDGGPLTYQAMPDDPITGCAGMSQIPQVTADAQQTTHAFTATATPESVESYIREFETVARQEDLYFRLLFTTGETNYGYGLIDATHPEAQLTWTPPLPAEVDPTGTLVRFYGQIADERNAVFPFERAVCLVRP